MLAFRKFFRKAFRKAFFRKAFFRNMPFAKHQQPRHVADVATARHCAYQMFVKMLVEVFVKGVRERVRKGVRKGFREGDRGKYKNTTITNFKIYNIYKI